MRPLHRTGTLVRRPVVIGAVRLGAAVDAVFDQTLGRLLGLEVRLGDGAHRFLPFPACEVQGDRLTIESPLVLLQRELGFYRGGGSAFSDLRGRRVRLDSREIGSLADLLVDEDGSVQRRRRLGARGRCRARAGPGVGGREPPSPAGRLN